jgi:hypothetical protein
MVSPWTRSGESQVPKLNAIVDGTGSFKAIQLYVNDVKSAQQLLDASSMELSVPRKGGEKGEYQAKIVFDLLLIDEVLKTAKGAK